MAQRLQLLTDVGEKRAEDPFRGLRAGPVRFSPIFPPVRQRIDLITKLPQERTSRGILDRKSTRLNSSHVAISYAVFCLKKKKAAKLVSLSRASCDTPTLD